jgi:hypothetical protein
MFNGHKNWNHWNVNLWICNDEGLYTLVTECIREAPSKDHAARFILDTLRESGAHATPDGAPYTFATVRAALRGFDRA